MCILQNPGTLSDILQQEFFSSVFITQYAIYWKKKWSHSYLKSWVTGGTEIRPGIPSSWRIFESNLHDIVSQFELHVDIDMTHLTQIFSNYSESRVEFQFRQWLNFLGENNSIFSFSASHHIYVSNDGPGIQGNIKSIPNYL